MQQKIHCNLIDIFGPNWAQTTDVQIECIIQSIHAMQLRGQTKNELYGFVGTVSIEDVIGGYFVIQFPTELISFTPDKTAQIETTSPAETVLFVLFPRVGRLLLQNRHFQILPIGMEVIQERLKETLAEALLMCKVGPLISLSPTSMIVEKTEIVSVFESSTKVTRISVSDPDPSRIPDGFTYYNPKKDRNSIIRDSRLHDYPELAKIDLTAKKDSDLKSTHQGRDLIQSISEKSRFSMSYTDQKGQQKMIRKERRAKFEFHIDIDGKQLTQNSLKQILEIIGLETTSFELPVSNTINPQNQMGLFSNFDDEDADED